MAMICTVECEVLDSSLLDHLIQLRVALEPAGQLATEDAGDAH
jgi:hypothetical protein